MILVAPKGPGHLVRRTYLDGSGIPAGNARHSGLANMKYRAEQLGGTCEITNPPEGGTRVHWIAPLNGY